MRKPLKLLLIEHHMDSQDLSRDMPAAKYKVDVCEDVEEARSALELIKPDILISDWNLPDGTAAPVLDAVRRKNLDARIIVLANTELEAVQELAAAHGAERVLPRPVSVKVLLGHLALPKKR